MIRWHLLVVGLVGTLFLTAPVVAQEGTPEGTPAAEPPVDVRIVPAAECETEPMAVDALSSLLGLDAEGVQAPPYPDISAPLGERAGFQTERSITRAVRQIIACFNAGDIPRAAALMTENGITRTYWGLTVDQAARDEATARLAAPVPREDDQALRLIEITDISRLADGRTAAFVVINDPLLPPAGAETLLFIFTRQDRDWLLDDWIDFSITPIVAATPPA